MGSLALIRSGFGRAALALAVLLVQPLAAAADEITAEGPAVAGSIVIHDAAETLGQYCRADADGVLWLELPGGARYELITSVYDEAISNHGDGTFHPFAAGEVAAALAAVRYPLDGIAVDVFILPYPRRAGLASAAGTGLILLAPGVYELSPEQQHAEFVHELGHAVQRVRLPDASVAGWNRYRALRGITDTDVYSADAAHVNRPHEIFAEDFRALFGGELATATGTIENASITPPRQVVGLEAYLLALSDTSVRISLGAWPNPSQGAVVFSRRGVTRSALDVFDVTGRRLVTLESQSGAGDVQRWSWDGRDASGRHAGPGVVFARTRDGGSATRVTLLR